jgi:hypothetical protein
VPVRTAPCRPPFRSSPIRAGAGVGGPGTTEYGLTVRLYDAQMPRLACWSCGRQIYTVTPVESLFAEERRCPRCGAFLNADRRELERRAMNRRLNPVEDPGPPSRDERRADERRQTRRRKNAADGSNRTGGWATR